MKTIGVISDTHINAGGKRALPPQVFEAFENVDFILHAGDLNIMQVVADLEAIAPVFAVRGNNDDFETMAQLPSKRRLEIEDCVIGLTHGDRGSGLKTPDIALSNFAEDQSIRCIVFGHSHWPLIEWRAHLGRQILLFNPGSAGKKRKAPHHSCGLLHVDGSHLEAQLITW